MSGLAPTDTDARPEENEGDDLRVLWLDDEDADTLISSLSSETARSILTALHRAPKTASEISESVGTSLQNVRHHLGKLQQAGLVEVVETRYSVKGREMNVYGPVNGSLVVCVGREEDREGFLDSLSRVVGVVAGLLVASLAVQWAFGAGVVDLGGPASAPRVADSIGGSAAPIFGLLPPGLAFLAGGVLVLAAFLAWERLSA